MKSRILLMVTWKVRKIVLFSYKCIALWNGALMNLAACTTLLDCRFYPIAEQSRRTNFFSRVHTYMDLMFKDLATKKADARLKCSSMVEQQPYSDGALGVCKFKILELNSLIEKKHDILKTLENLDYTFRRLSIEYKDRDEMIVAHMVDGVDAFIKIPQGWPIANFALKVNLQRRLLSALFAKLRVLKITYKTTIIYVHDQSSIQYGGVDVAVQPFVEPVDNPMGQPAPCEGSKHIPNRTGGSRAPPTHKVGKVLLSCAFLYDIFWVFVSKWMFHESVMIVVARGDKSGESIPMLLKK
ncbi:signal peptide peptidase-like protein 4 [Tanacetum coccineum]